MVKSSIIPLGRLRIFFHCLSRDLSDRGYLDLRTYKPNAPMNSIPQSPRQHERSFPLISMIQLATLTIALVTCIDGPELLRLMDLAPNYWGEMITLVLGAGFFGLLIGGSIGLGQMQKWRSMFFCGAVGMIAGLLILATYAAPAEPAQAFTAAALPLITTIALRIRSA